jgi:hypothetical protein
MEINVTNILEKEYKMSYAHPEYLVDTEWVANHLTDATVRIIESDEDPLLYPMGHIQGAVQVDWFSTLQHPIRRDFATREQFEEICSKLGITNNTTLVFYGDKSNWFACYALWLFQYYGHKNVKIMNGGRAKWEQEKRPLVKEISTYARTTYSAKEADKSIRAFRDAGRWRTLARGHRRGLERGDPRRRTASRRNCSQRPMVSTPFFLLDNAPLNAPRMHLKSEPLPDGFGQMHWGERWIGRSLLGDKLHHLVCQLVSALRSPLVRKQTEYSILVKRRLRLVERRA